MWQRVDEMDAKFPIGPGTLPSTTPLAIGTTGGAEKVTLEEDNIPLFEIDPTYALESGANRSSVGLIVDDDRQATPNPNPIMEFGKDPPDEVDIMPPYRVICFIRKTARTHYRA